MKLFKATILLIGASGFLSLTGCLTMAARSLTTKNKDYVANQTIPQGQSKLTVYAFGGGPNAFNFAGRMLYFSLGNKVHMISGNTYCSIPLSPGRHEVTYGNVVKEGFVTTKVQKGLKSLPFSVQGGEEVYLRISLDDPNVRDLYDGAVVDRGKTAQLQIVPKETALGELRGLKLYKDSDSGLKIKE